MSRCALLVVVILAALASAQVSRRPTRYPYAKTILHPRYVRQIKVDPQTGTVSGSHPVGGGNIYGKVAGPQGEFGYKGNIFNDQRGKLDGSVYHNRDLSSGASGMGGRLDWGSNRGKATLDVNRMDKTWNAAGGGSWKINKNIDAGVEGTYRHTPRLRDDYGIRGTITGRF